MGFEEGEHAFPFAEVREDGEFGFDPNKLILLVSLVFLSGLLGVVVVGGGDVGELVESVEREFEVTIDSGREVDGFEVANLLIRREVFVEVFEEFLGRFLVIGEVRGEGSEALREGGEFFEA